MINSQKIFIYGAPGVGKTTYSLKLKKELGYGLVEADYLREVVAQKEKTKEQDPFLYVGTKEAWRHFGKLTEENVINGLMAVRNSMWPFVEKEIGKHSANLILEAAFLDPEKLRKLGKLVLITTPDENKHRQQFFQHRKESAENIEGFQAARIIQQYLIAETINKKIQKLENTI